jgi:tetratricopeptide (TPR) repeat protein
MKLLLPLISLAFSLAAAGFNYPGQIKLRNQTKPLRVTVSKVDQWGNIFCSHQKKDMIIRSRSYIWVIVDKPDILKMAEKSLKDGQYIAAGNAFRDAEKMVGKLGWKLTCVYGQAAALRDQEKNADALELLEPCLKYEMSYPDGERPQLDQCLMLLSQLAKPEKALEALTLLRESNSPANSLSGFTGAAEIKLKAEKFAEARDFLLQAVVMFKKETPGRKEALEQLVTLLREHRDDLPDSTNLPDKYAEMLKKEYPPESKTKSLLYKPK